MNEKINEWIDGWIDGWMDVNHVSVQSKIMGQIIVCQANNKILLFLNFISFTGFQDLFAIIGSVLHLGNLEYQESDDGLVQLKDVQPLQIIAKVGLLLSRAELGSVSKSLIVKE